MADLPPEFLEILHCPECLREQLEREQPRHAPLALEGESLACKRCGRRYAVRDGWLPDLVSPSAGPDP